MTKQNNQIIDVDVDEPDMLEELMDEAIYDNLAHAFIADAPDGAIKSGTQDELEQIAQLVVIDGSVDEDESNDEFFKAGVFNLETYIADRMNHRKGGYTIFNQAHVETCIAFAITLLTVLKYRHAWLGSGQA